MSAGHDANSQNIFKTSWIIELAVHIYTCFYVELNRVGHTACLHLKFVPELYSVYSVTCYLLFSIAA